MRKVHVVAIVTTVLLSLGMLGFYRAGVAAPPRNEPFANSVAQRQEMIKELQAIRQLLAEQNKLLQEQNELLRKQLGQKR
ncbi:MAG: hypothetical protein D6741_01400 [Planctomycetota bacterium]|nr:MAG: hypothetical protein D6741_01400 [Planctomycetota bacterium]